LVVFEPDSGTSRELASRLPVPLSGHAVTRLRDGRVAVFGGHPGSGFPIAGLWFVD
jgi:hypothetical protein